MALLLPFGLLGIAVMALATGWGILRILLFSALVWVVILVTILVAPAAETARFGALDPVTWIVSGMLVGVVVLYTGFIRFIRQRVSHQSAGPGTCNAVPVTTHESAASVKNDDALDRYARHYVLREIGGPGQARLRDANVLIVGVGGLGAPAALYLAAAGVGQISIADPDDVSVSNLQRQIIFRNSDSGHPKVLAAAEALRALNPSINITPVRRAIGAHDADLIRGFDLVLDGTDNFSTRKIINEVCVAAGVPLIAGAISQWEGQLTIYDPAGGAPCLACIFPEPPADGLALPCADAGVVGPLPGVIGSMMALETIKYITESGKGLSGRLLIYDGLYGETRTILIQRRFDCPVCSGVEPRSGEA